MRRPGASASESVIDGCDGRNCENTSAVCFVLTSGLEMIRSKSTPRWASALASFFSALIPSTGQRTLRIVRVLVTTFGGDAVSNEVELEGCHVSLPARRVCGSSAVTIFSGRDRLRQAAATSERTPAVTPCRAGTAATYFP